MLIALISVLSQACAITVDHYPHNHNYAHDNHYAHNHHYPHDNHYAQHYGHHYAHHPEHVKYAEPAHAVKYVQPAHVSPVGPFFKPNVAAPLKYVHQQPHPVKYISDPHLVKHVEYDVPAPYEYGYDVHDHATGDVKSHSEKSDGNGSVQGRYEVLDPDG